MADTTVRIELGGAFWVLIILLFVVGFGLVVLGPNRLRGVIEGGIGDAFHRGTR